MQAEEILGLFRELNDELAKHDVKAEACLYGGAVMCLVYKARPSTKDVDAIFEPSQAVRDAARAVAQRCGRPPDWDAVKGFLADHEREVFAQWSNLSVYVPEPDYLLAMKCMASRVDSTDNADIRFLIGKLGMATPAQVFAAIEKYYPRGQIKPATQFFIEEILENP